MADRYWVGGTANWDGTAGTKWATTSGGAGGASVPTSADNVFFTNLSTGTCTISTGNTGARSINCTGFAGTIAGSAAITVSGSVTLVAGMTFTYSGTLTINATSTLTTAGKTIGPLTISGSGITVTLGDALTSSGTITVTQGTFTTNNFNVTASSLSSDNINTRTINLGSSTLTINNSGGSLNFGTNTNLTFNAGTSTISFANAAGINLFGGAAGSTGVNFYNVSFPTTSAVTHAVIAANTFNNITVAAPASAGVTQFTFDSRQTINGTLSTTGTAGNRRVWFRSSTYGIAHTLTINSAPSLTDADFRDIYVIGTAAPISGTRVGDLRGCRGITFDTPKTVYWNFAAGGNWSANAWAASSGGGVSTNNFPLAQDTATFVNTGLNTSATVTWDSAIPYTGTIDMSARTNAMNLSVGSGSGTIYGNLINGSGSSWPGGNTVTFSGRNTQTVTNAGKTFAGPFTVDSYGGTVELADALNVGSTNALTVTNGTFDTKNYNVTAGSLSSSNSNVRTITLGSSTVTLSGTTPISFGATNFTFNCGTSSISLTGSTANLNGAGVTFYDVSFTSTGINNKTMTGANTFNSLTFTAPATNALTNIVIGANQTITGTLTVAGATAVRRIFVQSDTLGATRTLTAGTLSATDCDFRDITIAGAAAGSSPTRAGDCGGNSGITFPAPKTVYWNLAGAQNWSATAWAPGSGGSPDINNFPLAQDTAVFDEAGSVTGAIQFNAGWNIGTFDASARTSAMTLDPSTATVTVYGDWKFGTGVTSSSTTGIITFAKRGTQTVTSNGVTFGCPITINCITGTVQLADALTLGSTRTLTLTSGTFDAVSYNVTTGLFSCSSATATLKMGSGTWTISGTGFVWTLGSATFYKGTANITLSSTSTSARTFDSSGFSYNKLTIGGATGTSTLTITGNNQFTELASTKTVAHTIALGSTAQTFGKWTVTGTVGNVVTLTGTGTAHLLAGACTSGIDYLAMGSIGFSASSPAEFYAGANSTGTAGAPVYRTAKPADSTRYWVGGTGNWSSTTKWSTSSGGGSGASVPRSHDDVVFDSASNATAYTATVDAVTGGNRCKSLTISGPASGNVTLAGNQQLFIHDDITLPATGLTRTYTGAITLTGSTSGKTLTTNGVALASAITVNGVGCEWTLGSALTIGTSNNFTVTNGLIDFDTYNVTVGAIVSNGSNSRTIDFGSSVVSIGLAGLNFGTTETVAANLTIVAGTSTINIDNTNGDFDGNGKTFHDVAFTSSSAGGPEIRGVNTFNNLSFTGVFFAGVKIILVYANQTINGTLTFVGGPDATCRQFFRSDTLGTTRTLTCAAVSLVDVDFRDITIAGVAAPATGTRIGDCKGNSGITFTAAANKYWNLAGNNNWSATAWATSSGGSPSVNNFPLAQDTCIFESTSPGTGATTTINAGYNIGTIDMSARTTNTMTLPTTALNIYGNWINGTGITLVGTGTIIFVGRGSQTITSAGRTFTQGFTIDTPGGSVTLQDALVTNINSANALVINKGSFDAGTYNLTLSGATSNVRSFTTTTRTIGIGSGTWSIAGSSNCWDTSTSTNLTVTGTGTISLTSGTTKTFAGGGIAYTNITLNQGGAGTLTITGNNTFNDITNTYKATGATIISLATTTQRVSQWTAAGESGRVLTVQGASASSPATLVLTGATKPDVDYLTITGVRAYSLIDTWYAGANSTNNGSLGWYFQASGGTIITASFQDTATGSDQFSAVATFLVSFQDTAAGSDQVVAGEVFLSVVEESVTGSDAITTILNCFSAFSDSATALDSISASATLISSVAEISTGSDEVSATKTFSTAIDESAAGTDTTSSAQTFAVAVQDQASGADQTLVAPSIFNATAQDTAQAIDVFRSNTIFPASVAEQIAMTDTIIGGYLWNLISDSQDANWQNVNTTQAPGWANISTAVDPNWTNVDTI